MELVSGGFMNKPMLLACALMGVTTCVHVFGGGPEIHQPIQTSDLPSYLRAISAVLWHAVTVILMAFAIALAWVSLHPNRPLEWMIALVQVGFAGLFLFYGVAILGTPWPMPQWVVFLLIPGVMLFGMRGQA